jgi:hypothetical protein
VINDLKTQGFSREKPFHIGFVEGRMMRFAKANGVELERGSIYMRVNEISHALRDTKNEKGIAVSSRELISFPQRRTSMDLYFDKKTKNFTYVDGHSKYIVSALKNKKVKVSNKKVSYFVTAQKLNRKEVFDGERFMKV